MPYNNISYRQFSLTSLYQALGGMPEIDLFAFFQLQLTCCDEIFSSLIPDDCNVTWYEHPSLTTGHGSVPTRQVMSNYLANNERKIAEFLGYWPGPTLIENEVHTVTNWTRFIRTNYCRVIRAGKRKLTKVDTDINRIITQQKSQPGALINDEMHVLLGDVDTPFINDLDCNFWIYPNDHELQDNWAIRPFCATRVDSNTLAFDFPLWVAIDPAQYYGIWPDRHGRLKRLCVCDDIYTPDVSIYQESWDLPHGYVRLATEYCPVCGGNDSDNCEVCNLPELPICLQPRDWKRGIFQFRPISNTGTEGEPCWIVSESLESCCSATGNLKGISGQYLYQCYCNQPLDVEINYVSSCHGSWFDECVPNDTCPEIIKPLIDMTLADMLICECGCLNDTIKRLNQDIMLLGANQRTQTITRDMLTFGTRKGDLEAYEHLKNFVPRKFKRTSISYI